MRSSTALLGSCRDAGEIVAGSGSMVTDKRFLKAERAFEAFAADVLGRVRVWAARDPSAVDAST